MSALSELILSKNNIEELPTNIGLLRNLRTLNLDENKLKSLPSDVFILFRNIIAKIKAENLYLYRLEVVQALVYFL